MTIDAIKSILGLTVLVPSRGTTEDGQPSEWFSFIDVDKKVRVVFHQDIIPHLGTDQLVVSPPQERVGPKMGTFKSYTIFKPNTEIVDQMVL